MSTTEMRKLLDLCEAKIRSYRDADDFAEKFAKEIDSGFEFWLGNANKEKLYKLYLDGKRISAVTVYIPAKDDKKYDQVKEKIESKKSSMESKGFTLFDENSNDEYHEMIFVK